MLLDLPSLAFFTTYALLVLFWAEIYYQVQPRSFHYDFLSLTVISYFGKIFTFKIWQARAVSTDGLRPTFYTVNGVVYFIQVNNLAHF